MTLTTPSPPNPTSNRHLSRLPRAPCPNRLRQDAAGNSANVFYYNIAVEEVDVLDSIKGKEESLKQQVFERDLLR